MNTPNTYLGIDPGGKGAFVLIDGLGQLLKWSVMPAKGAIEPQDIWQIVTDMDSELGGPFVAIEKAQAMPGQGVSSMFRYGMGFGYLEAFVIAAGFRYELVHPRVWSKTMLAGTDGRLEGKARNSQAAKRLLPGFNFLASSRSKKPHEGLIDAYLIAEWVRRKRLGLT